MVDSIGIRTSVVGNHLLIQRPSHKDVSFKPRLVPCRLVVKDIFGQRLSIGLSSSRSITGQKCNRFVDMTARSLAMELTKQARPPKEDGRRIPRDMLDFTTDSRIKPSRMWPPSNKADKPIIHNPLVRQERMGCGWFTVIFEWEGVIAEYDAELEKQAWLLLSEEEGKSPPPAFILKRIEGMKNEQAISEVLCWSRDPGQLRRLSSRKEEIYQNLQGGGCGQIRPGSQELMSTLVKQKIPLAVASTRPRKNLEESMEKVGVQGFFDVIVAAEDVYRGKPDPEMFIYTAQLLNFIPERCIVFGNSNSTVEAAHDAQMKCVAVASKHPVYELSAADLVVNRLDELSIVDLKNLADIDALELEPEPEMEEEEENSSPSSRVGLDDFSW